VATRAIQQLLFEVAWAPLDVLVIDTPPGTGDVLLTLAQQVQLQGAVLVTTPQQLVDTQVRRGLEALHRLSIPVLGVVENMAYIVCPHCGQKHDIFGSPHWRAAALAKLASCQVMAQLPLTPTLCETADQGRMDQDQSVQTIFGDLASQVAALLGFPV
jgi:ATP-binding protein involved in chromosome partitioning